MSPLHTLPRPNGAGPQHPPNFLGPLMCVHTVGEMTTEFYMVAKLAVW